MANIDAAVGEEGKSIAEHGREEALAKG